MPKLIDALLILALLPAGLHAGEFEADAHTLLLAHFNKTVRSADYAVGVGRFAGNGACLTEGYYGKAIDLRARGLFPDFARACEDATPRYDGWGFRPRGNADPAQGTFECWVRVPGAKDRLLPGGGGFLSAPLARSVKHPEKDYYVSTALGLTRYGLRYCLPTLAGNAFIGSVLVKSVKGYGKYLKPEDWHHFALCWSPGEAVIWLDGRPLATFDMSGQLGLAFVSNPVLYMSMSDCVVDELRISNRDRYSQDFEPAWRDGQRPEVAFSGVPGLKRYPARSLARPAPRPLELERRGRLKKVTLGQFDLRFDGAGRLAGLRVGRGRSRPSANGLLLYRGLDRGPLAAEVMKNFRIREGRACFDQVFSRAVKASHEIWSEGKALRWRVTLSNAGQKEIWLEPLLSIPLPFPHPSEFFDGCEPKRVLHLPRHRDLYILTLPFVAASGGGQFLGAGIDPRTDLSDIVSEWVPLEDSAILRQGTKVALAPGESFILPFYVIYGEGEFGTLDAIDTFHSHFPSLYRFRPDVPVYSYMPATQHSVSDKFLDMKRQGYAGSFWGHGPGHDKGDEFGTPHWWDNPKYDHDKHYSGYTRRLQRMWRNIGDLRQYITLYFRQAFENYYPVRRFHTCPDMTPDYIIQDLWPGHVPNEDPLCFGQYYEPIWAAQLVNEFNTPFGAHFCQQTRQYFRQLKGTSPGFINDMSHAGSIYRHNDPVAKRTSGRSFSRDLGTFVRKALGRKQRYEILNHFVDDGHRASFWSDGGAFSYTLCAYSATLAIEGAGMYRGLTGKATYVIPARNLLGEKPFSAMTHINDDWTGRFLSPEEFTPPRLRDYYRFCDRQLVLFCLEHGVTLDPSSYMFGRQFSLESAPLMVESTVLGRKLVPGARVAAPLWVRRAGNALDTLLVVGNTQPRGVRTDLEIANRYFPAAPLFVARYGGETIHRVEAKVTTVKNLRVSPRDLVAFKGAALLETKTLAEVTTKFSGDGIQLEVEIEITTKGKAGILFSAFGPVYEISDIRLNGRPVRIFLDEPLVLRPGKNQIQVRYQNRSLNFTRGDWQAVDLVSEGKTNFCIIADPGIEYRLTPEDKDRFFLLGFERGTANLLNQFLEQYDSEDGQLGNLEQARILGKKPEDYSGWTILLDEDRVTRPGRVRIDRRVREIRIEGATQGEIRRAMVVFLRLVDRKYPHVGRFFPLRYSKQPYQPGQPVPLEKWVVRKPTLEFFKNITDPDFLAKPILRREFEPLYQDGRMDFAGKYQMRHSPDIFEPTYGDDFVYGYSGPGTAETREDQIRRPRPAE